MRDGHRERETDREKREKGRESKSESPVVIGR
jgi:hypothetical protein